MFHSKILNALQDKEKKDITLVDVGCSTGEATENLTQFLESCGYGVYVIGIDYNRENLKEAYKSRRVGNPIQARVNRLPIKGGVADVVVCYGVLPYLSPEFRSPAIEEKNLTEF